MKLTSKTTILLSLYILTIISNTVTRVLGKEVVAKKDEWTVVEEGDSIPAGLHVKIDLSTGEKLVKLIDEEDGVEMDESKAALIVSEEFGSAGVEIEMQNLDKLNDAAEEWKSRDSYDYVAMHKALSHLPVEEKERMGGIPDIPPFFSKNRSGYEGFKKRMKEIWEQRQEELKKAQITDIAKTLMGHIAVMENSLGLQESVYQEYIQEGSTLLNSLADLEYLLSDLDTARDFHTLGGWSVLISFLASDNLSIVENESKNATYETFVKPRFDEEVRVAAAWAIGTAVKNIEEFHPWAIEQFEDTYASKEFGLGKNITALSSLLDMIKESNNNEYDRNFNGNQLYQKSIYAIGSLLRGNILARNSFLQLGGPDILANTLLNSESNWKLSSKIILLVHDIIEEIISESLDEKDRVIERVRPFTTIAYCESTLSLLKSPSIQTKEKSLMALKTMIPYCKHHSNWKIGLGPSLDEFILAWRNNSEGVDTEWYEEIMKLSQDVKSMI